MRLTSPNPSDSPSSPRRRHRLRRRRRPPPSPSPSSISPVSETPPSDIAGNRSDSPSSLPVISTASSSSSSSSSPIFLSAVVPLPLFRGVPGDCPFAHLTLFHRLFPSSGDGEPSSPLLPRYFPLTLLDDAALWHELSVRPSTPWADVRSAFLRAFRPPDSGDRTRAELLSLRQRAGESVTSYHLRMRWMLKRWPEHGLPEPLLRGVFVEGLREEVREWVEGRRTETVEEAVRAGTEWEARRRRMREEWMKEMAEEGRRTTTTTRKRSECRCAKHRCWRKYGAAIAGGEDDVAADDAAEGGQLLLSSTRY